MRFDLRYKHIGPAPRKPKGSIKASPLLRPAGGPALLLLLCTLTSSLILGTPCLIRDTFCSSVGPPTLCTILEPLFLSEGQLGGGSSLQFFSSQLPRHQRKYSCIRWFGSLMDCEGQNPGPACPLR